MKAVWSHMGMLLAGAWLVSRSCVGAQEARDHAQLRRLLSSDSESEQALALRQLDSGRLAAEDTEWLLGCLQGKRDPKAGRAELNLRINCAYLLGFGSDRRSVARLGAQLGDANAGLQAECILAMARLGDRRGVRPLLNFLERGRGSRTVRGVAACALGKLGDPVAIPVLIDLVGESGRVFPQWDLLGIGDAAVEPVMRAVAAKPRQELVFTLGELRDPRAVPLLEGLVAGPDPEERVAMAALCALRKIKSRAAVAALESAAKGAASAGLRGAAARLHADVLRPMDQALEVPPRGTLAALQEEARGEALARLDRAIESFDVPWQVKERAREQAVALRRGYRFPGPPRTWDSLVHVLTVVRTPEGKEHRCPGPELEELQKRFGDLVADVDQCSQGRLRLQLLFHFEREVVRLGQDKEGTVVLPRAAWAKANERLKSSGADHLFMTWVVPEGFRGPPYSNGGAASQIPVSRKAGSLEWSGLGALHELVHSMNHCLAGAGYEEGQMPPLHRGVAQLACNARRLDGSHPERVRNYLVRYFTGGMWAALSRSDAAAAEQNAEDEEIGP